MEWQTKGIQKSCKFSQGGSSYPLSTGQLSLAGGVMLREVNRRDLPAWPRGRPDKLLTEWPDVVREELLQLVPEEPDGW